MCSYDLDRFKIAQRRDYAQALAEISAGRKRSHWIWYVFPQVQGLGYSQMCRIYGISGLEEATAYLKDDELRLNLERITRALLAQGSRDAQQVMGHIDALKLRSCMTLFALVEGASPLYRQVVDEFFDGVPDERTLEMLGATWQRLD